VAELGASDNDQNSKAKQCPDQHFCLPQVIVRGDYDHITIHGDDRAV
jgi:hypothetical protein